ncbi:MAG: ATP-binding protein [Halopseudomonas sp.]|uniref:ATP-binding protein n=1 Tax=Halopseudomonas sp. TaxID=2901191 RepID=UPI0030028AE5
MLLPWLLALLGLQLLYQIYTHHHLALLTLLIPLARLFILYGLLCLAGEWLLQRIAQQAGSFLNQEQLTQVQQAARVSAGLVVLLLLLRDFVALGVGPSRVLDICEWLCLLGFLLALGLLLRCRRQDLVEALKSVLPSRCDRAVDLLLSQRYFLLTAPFAAPPLLLALLASFLHKTLFDYDWYRRLFARSFKLRAAAIDTPPAELTVDPQAQAEYAQWFGQSDSEHVPFIDSGLYQHVRKDLSHWLDDDGTDNSLLLTGSRGAGKSSVLKQLTQDLAQEQPHLQLRLCEVPGKVTTADEVASLLGELLQTDLAAGPAALVHSDAERSPTLVILDNAQNLFLRRVGGLAGWETLLALVNARTKNLFWLLVINNQGWAYLSNIYGRDYQFRKVRTTRPWSQNDIRSLILSRNHLSGYKIRYDDILLAARGPEAGNIRNAEQLYFSLLWDACQGNPLLALRLWLGSIYLQGNTVVVGLPDEVSATPLEQLDNDLHFVYAAIMIHENMTSAELVSVTALPERVVRTALKTGLHGGFIQRAENKRYRVVPLWYPSLMRLLARKNLLHE